MYACTHWFLHNCAGRPCLDVGNAQPHDSARVVVSCCFPLCLATPPPLPFPSPSPPPPTKADQKRLSLALLETEVCSDFGFIEAALKCLHTAYKFCNQIQTHARAGDDFDGHPAALRSAMPCSAPSMPEIASFIVHNRWSKVLLLKSSRWSGPQFLTVWQVRYRARKNP